MAKFNDRLKSLRHEASLSQLELAKAIGTSKSSVNMYERGEREPGLEMLETIADYFNVDMDYLLGKSEHKSKAAWLDGIDDIATVDDLRDSYAGIFPIKKRTFPLLGEIACGEPITANENLEVYVDAGADIEADFCLRAKGDSMSGARIYDGDIVFIRKQSMVDNGEIAAVIIDNEATLKRVNYYPQKNLLILKAENPKYEDFIFTDEQLENISIIGKAVFFQSIVK